MRASGSCSFMASVISRRGEPWSSSPSRSSAGSSAVRRSLARRLLNAGITHTEITRWQDAVSAEWATSGRDDFLRWKPLLWRFQLDAYLDSKANEGRIPKPKEDAEAPFAPGPADIRTVVEKYEKWSRLWSPEPTLRTAICDPEWRLPAHAWLQLGCIGLDGTRLANEVAACRIVVGGGVRSPVPSAT